MKATFVVLVASSLFPGFVAIASAQAAEPAGRFGQRDCVILSGVTTFTDEQVKRQLFADRSQWPTKTNLFSNVMAPI